MKKITIAILALILCVMHNSHAMLSPIRQNMSRFGQYARQYAQQAAQSKTLRKGAIAASALGATGFMGYQVLNDPQESSSRISYRDPSGYWPLSYDFEAKESPKEFRVSVKNPVQAFGIPAWHWHSDKAKFKLDPSGTKISAVYGDDNRPTTKGFTLPYPAQAKGQNITPEQIKSIDPVANIDEITFIIPKEHTYNIFRLFQNWWNRGSFNAYNSDK